MSQAWNKTNVKTEQVGFKEAVNRGVIWHARVCNVTAKLKCKDWWCLIRFKSPHNFFKEKNELLTSQTQIGFRRSTRNSHFHEHRFLLDRCRVSGLRKASCMSRTCVQSPLPPSGGCSHTLPIRVCAAQRGLEFRTGNPFQRHFLERGIIFRTHENSSFVSSYLKLFKDRLLLKIRFNARVNKQTVVLLLHPERSIKNWPISRTGYQF